MKTESNFNPEKLQILYEDKFLVVIYKPEGLLSVPYPGSRTKTAQDIIEQIMRKKGTYSKNHKPYAVHRLDRETSGVMMFALSENCKNIIMNSWQKMVTERFYIALAENSKIPLPDSGLIDDGIAFNAYNVGFVPKNNNSFKKTEFKTISARTNYKVLKRGKKYSLFELSLDTGRKNQIRAHLASKGYPLAGDKNYRAKTNPFNRLCLHAKTLEFIHPFTKETMKFEIPEPKEWTLKATDSIDANLLSRGG